LRKLPCDTEVRGKEMPVIPLNRMVDKKMNNWNKWMAEEE
jgi:hypothetical protein